MTAPLRSDRGVCPQWNIALVIIIITPNRNHHPAMKFLALFALVAVCAGAAVSPITTSEWTLAELSAAIENPATDPATLPYLEQALNEIMDSLMAGGQQVKLFSRMGFAAP